MKHFVIIANGPFLPEEIIREAITDKIIVALDGATNKLSRLQIKPDIILGDFDSIDDDSRNKYGVMGTFTDIDDETSPYTGKENVQIVPAKRQSATDLQKAIRYCDKLGAAEITILCATGGRMDFHESNIRTLRSHYHPSRQMTIHTEQQSLRYVKDETIIMKGIPEDKCGIVGYPEGSMTSEGLEYETSNFPLKFGFSESTCNALKKHQAKIRISGEALIIMPPMLQSQRTYMQKSEKERLQSLLITADS